MKEILDDPKHIDGGGCWRSSWTTSMKYCPINWECSKLLFQTKRNLATADPGVVLFWLLFLYNQITFNLCQKRKQKEINELPPNHSAIAIEESQNWYLL